VNNQNISAAEPAPGLPGRLPDADVEAPPTVYPFDRFERRAAEYAHLVRGAPPILIAAERVTSHIVSLPKTGARQRSALLTYAVEDRVAAPIDSVQVVQGPARSAPAGEVLALVVANDVYASFEARGVAVLPDVFLIPRPEPGPTGPAWAVWRDGDRALVRLSDGTGFAVSVGLLAVLWDRAGGPVLTSLGDPLPDELPARDLSAAPPPPEAFEMAFSLVRPWQERRNMRGIAAFVGSALTAALIVHVGLAFADLYALERIAERERLRAQAAIATTLPDVTLDRANSDAILSRLAPVAVAQSGGAFLPLLSDVTLAMAGLATPVRFRRLAWGAQDGSLVTLVEGRGLEDLQQLQRLLEDRGFTVRSGAANANDGAAEVEMRISRGAAR